MMSSKERVGDLTFFLFLVPFIASGVYAIYLWAQAGFSALLPKPVFLQVAESPYVFLLGFTAVLIGATIDVRSVELPKRRQKLAQESNTLQFIAVVALVLGALAAWYSAGFDLGNAAGDMIEGRYAIIFPVLLIAVSFLMLPSVSIKRSSTRYVLMLVSIVGAVGIIDEVGKHNYDAGIFLAGALLAIAIYIFLSGPALTSTGAKTGQAGSAKGS